MSETSDFFEIQDENRAAQGVECQHGRAWELCSRGCWPPKATDLNFSEQAPEKSKLTWGRIAR